METLFTKNEKLIAGICLSVIVVFFALFFQISKTKSHSHFETAGDVINYRMARPDQVYSEYNLDGREIDDTYIALEQKKKAVATKLEKQKQDLIAQKKAEAKKKVEEKKKKEETALHQQLERSKSKALKAFEKADIRKTSTAGNSNAQDYAQSPYYVNNTTQQVVADAAATKDTANKKSFSEWRTLLLAEPTSDNLALFIAAYHRNEVTAVEYQSMAQDLISQQDTKLKALGLMALRAVPSLSSLSQLVHLDAATQTAFASYVEQSFNAYLMPQNLGYLSQALMTQDNTLISKSLNLLDTNLNKFLQGDLSSLSDPRNLRDGSVVTFSIADYRSLIPALTQITTTNSDQNLVAAARDVASLIESSNNVAIN